MAAPNTASVDALHSRAVLFGRMSDPESYPTLYDVQPPPERRPTTTQTEVSWGIVYGQSIVSKLPCAIDQSRGCPLKDTEHAHHDRRSGW